jgi:hypothetical protein
VFPNQSEVFELCPRVGVLLYARHVPTFFGMTGAILWAKGWPCHCGILSHSAKVLLFKTTQALMVFWGFRLGLLLLLAA